ncbi:hypothetical protein B7463_g5430, partial [Scytalidium lignicola]
MSSSQKIRIGLIGLNAPYAGVITGSSWAAVAHLPYLKASSKYEVVALHNSSVERAQKAIEAYGLDPEKVKAYGTPEGLANDPNVELVVCSVRVDRHAGSVIPSIKAGKDVYVEWPLEANYHIAKELTELVKKHNVKSFVGLQGNFSPVVKKIKEVIANGDIGDVLSSIVIVKARGGPTISRPVDYFTDRKIGGNTFTIGFGHNIEYITAALGEVSSYRSLLVNQFPEVDIVDPVTHEIVEKSRKNDVPNQIAFEAVLESGAVLTFKLNTAPAISPGAKPQQERVQFPVLDWHIVGTKGELRIKSYDDWLLSGGSAKLVFEICKADDGEVVQLDLGQDEFEHLPLYSRNIARLYEAFAEGLDEKGEKKKWYPDFERALKRHKLLDQMYKENGFN